MVLKKDRNKKLVFDLYASLQNKRFIVSFSF